MLDALYPKVRTAGKLTSLPVLVALAMKETGGKALLVPPPGEQTGEWLVMREDTAARDRGQPCLIIGDGNPELKRAMAQVWHGVAHQRCTVHPSADGRKLLAKAPQRA